MSYALLFSTIVSRHGIRAPFSPPNITECNEYYKYSDMTFPAFDDWGMTDVTYCDQQLTPHGVLVVPRMGEYYRTLYTDPDFAFSCDKVAVYADNSTRDIQTATLLVEGLGCNGETDVLVAGANDLTTSVWPVVSDNYNALGCPLATEDQVSGLYGGSVASITDAYEAGIQTITDTIAMTATDFNASICDDVNPTWAEDEDAGAQCTLFDTGYQWTDLYYQGDFLSPLSYAGYFAEYFMFQYLSDLTDYAFGALTGSDIQELYGMHVQNMYYGSNIWNSRAMGSQQLGYILASMQSFLDGSAAPGVEQAPSHNVLMLASHDFNQFYLQRLLGLNYFSYGFPENVATTAGSLRFDLYQDAEQDNFVTVTYTAATPDQQRSNTNLTDPDTPPGIAQIVIPACGTFYCPYETFVETVSAAIDLACVEEPLSSTLGGYANTGNGGGGDDDDDKADVYMGWAISMTVLLSVGIVYVAANHFYMKSIVRGDAKEGSSSLNTGLSSSA